MLKVTKKKRKYLYICCVKCVVRNMSGNQGCFVWLMNRCDVSLLRLFPPSGMFDEMQSALSSPGLDSLNSSADLTLDTTGELTVEDVKDFLVWVLDLQTWWQTLLIWSHFIELFLLLFSFLCVAFRIVYGIQSTFVLLCTGLWMRLRITWGIWARRTDGFLGFLSTDGVDSSRWVLL